MANRLKPLKKQREQAEQRIAALDGEKAQLEGRMATSLAAADMADAGRRLKAVADELERLEHRWLELAGEIEAAEATSG